MLTLPKFLLIGAGLLIWALAFTLGADALLGATT